MENLRNRQIVLQERPSGMPDRNVFKIIESDLPPIEEGQLLCRNLYVSVDPYMRGRMNESDTPGYAFPLHSVIRGRTIGKVIRSKNDLIKEGALVMGMMGWEEYSVVDASAVEKLEEGIAPASAYLGVLGITGLTAYFGLLSVGELKAGDHVVISAAAGAVGTVAGQIARINDCHVTGIAGSSEKIRMLREDLHFDEAINYKKSRNLKDDIQAACPEGVDVYFDNVGGEISDAVLSLINRHARIAVCGQISLYNLREHPTGPRVQPILLAHQAKMQGFTVNDYSSRYPAARKQLAIWLKEGKLKSLENVVEGFENIPEAFLGLFKGENKGKQVVKLAPEE